MRHYEELGLLESAHVDPDIGYCYFAAEQVADTEAIRRLRFLELALDEIHEILETDDPALIRTKLARRSQRCACGQAG